MHHVTMTLIDTDIDIVNEETHDGMVFEEHTLPVNK